MGFQKVLFHTQFREMSLDALNAVMSLKTAGLREIVLTAVIPRDDVAFVPYGGFLKEEEERIRTDIARRFVPYQEAVAAAGLTSRVRIETGIVNAAVLDVAQTEAVDLIVTGRKHRTLMEHIYVGGHTLDLIRRSPVPILMGKFAVEVTRDGRTETRRTASPFRRPMLATDWSAPSQRALETLTALKGTAAHVAVVHVIGRRLAQGVTENGVAALEDESRKRLNGAVRRFEEAGIPASATLRQGRAVHELLEAAETENASVIVMGRTGKDWLQEYWLGGISHQVAEMAPLPVLLVP